MLLLPHFAGADLRGVSDPHVMSQRRDHLHKPLAVPGRFHADQCRCWDLPVEPFGLPSAVFQLFLLRLPRGCLHPTNLLPTGVVITSNNHHRRLLPTECFGPPTKSILGSRMEPSLLSNQAFGLNAAGFDFSYAISLAPRSGSLPPYQLDFHSAS